MKTKTWTILLISLGLMILRCGDTFLRWNLPKLASVETSLPEKLSNTSVLCTGNITDEGGSTVTERGICYSTTLNPTIGDHKIVSGAGLGTFTLQINGLTPNTFYYFRAYAITKTGISYGNETTIKTGNLPSLSTTAASSITLTSATTGGNVSGSDSSEIVIRGICYSTSPNPTVSDTKITSAGKLGSFSVNLTGLKPSTIYYARAFARISSGTVYGNEINFSTISVLLPVLSTAAASNVTHNSAVSGGNITNDGGSPVTSRGICYSTSHNPTTSDNKLTGETGNGNFALSITGLLPGTNLLYQVLCSQCLRDRLWK